jgi:hypothetical protein
VIGGINMSKKKNNNNKFPYSNEIKKIKDDFKKMIDYMPDEDFMDMIFSLMLDYGNFEDEDWCFDEEWEDEAIKFYNEENSNNSNLIDEDGLPF